jgi:hypothetical protein
MGRSHHDFQVIGVKIFAAVNGHAMPSLWFFLKSRPMSVRRFIRRPAESPLLGSEERNARLALVNGIVLSQRMALELVVEQQMAEIWAILKKDAVHFVALPLEPVRPLPERAQALNGGV